MISNSDRTRGNEGTDEGKMERCGLPLERQWCAPWRFGTGCAHIAMLTFGIWRN